ncbi:aminotransferase class I/II-fold pyridoxal phosphate-dependent enzyme [Micromonospora sonneratiae]|uniref:Aminotransferase class I/II-fold pyridoxal phosphate-dependent enzyme n=1 Tax=Micromonospora sonneratiae TaxID=1184706 RepID=A0ABW3YHP3_9ACTN
MNAARAGSTVASCSTTNSLNAKMHSEVEQQRKPSLTAFEIQALSAGINLTDGHPRQDLTPSQRKIVERLPQLFDQAGSQDFNELERRSQRAFMDAVGQACAPVESGRVHSIYASSVATTAVGYAMARCGGTIALLHPTFDNLHDLLSRHLHVVPLEEPYDAAAAPAAVAAQGATAIFLTTPNNPTGSYLDESQLQDLITGCLKHDLTLCLDTSFRGFDPRAQFDHYEHLEGSGVRYVVIEDTGKLWPVLELKLGFIAVSKHWQTEFEQVLSDILLSVSPLVLSLVEKLAEDAANGGLQRLQELMIVNRTTVANAVAEMPGVVCPDTDARVSVTRIQFPSAVAADRVHAGLLERGIHVLPCGPFHWAQPQKPVDTLRVALARNPDEVARAMTQLRDVWTELRA